MCTACSLSIRVTRFLELRPAGGPASLRALCLRCTAACRGTIQIHDILVAVDLGNCEDLAVFLVKPHHFNQVQRARTPAPKNCDLIPGFIDRPITVNTFGYCDGRSACSISRNKLRSRSRAESAVISILWRIEL